jgi:glycosyltransferase involved in cell wall biosynthesis
MRRKMGEKARELIERKYSWDVISEDIYRTYEDYRK